METAGTKPNRNATKNNNTQMAKQLNTYWDNYKIFLHWYLLTVIVAACGLIEIARLSQKLPNAKVSFPRLFNKPRLRKVLALTAVAVIIFFSTATGFLSHIKAFQESYLMWSGADVTFADWIRENTPPEALFLTSTHYLHPVFTIAGRQIVMGYEGWLWSHGIDWNYIQKVKRDVIEMFKGNYMLIKAYGVNFIAVTKYERFFATENNFSINLKFFTESPNFKKIYDKVLDGDSYILFEVL
jgi:hypothetical protein